MHYIYNFPLFIYPIHIIIIIINNKENISQPPPLLNRANKFHLPLKSNITNSNIIKSKSPILTSSTSCTEISYNNNNNNYNKKRKPPPVPKHILEKNQYNKNKEKSKIPPPNIHNLKQEQYQHHHI